MLLQVLPRRIARGEGPYNLLPRVRRRRRVLRWWWIDSGPSSSSSSTSTYVFLLSSSKRARRTFFSRGDNGRGDWRFRVLTSFTQPLCFHFSAAFHFRVHPPSCSGSCLPGRGHVSQLTSATHPQLLSQLQKKTKCASLPHLTWGITRRSDGGAPPPGESDGCAQRSLERTTQRTTLRVPSCGPKPGREKPITHSPTPPF